MATQSIREPGRGIPNALDSLHKTTLLMRLHSQSWQSMEMQLCSDEGVLMFYT